MFNRLARIVASFMAVLVTYWMYALVAVPLIEPSAQAMSRSPIMVQPKRDLNERYKQAYGKYFKPGDWELDGTPKVLESAQAKLFVQEYENLPDGRVKLHPCTLLFFPNPGKKDATGEEQAIMMRAPDGAILQFDEAFDLKRAKVGKLIGGKLVGKITISSTPSRPDSPEDLFITTRDVELLDDCVFTPHPVQFRLGKSEGSGREMRINLVKTDESALDKGPTSRFGEIESFEMARDVKLHVQIEPGQSGGSLLGGRTSRRDEDDEPTASTAAKPEPPVEVTCQGPFKFDVPRSLATFTDQVDVLRINPTGPSDQLNCELLAIQFGPRERPAKTRATAKGRGVERDGAPEAKPRTNQFDLEPRRVEAVGDPVIIRAPSQLGHARCQRLEYEIKTGRIVLEGSEDILLHQGSNELRTRRLDYRPGEAGRLGWLEVAGPGWLQGAMKDRPQEKYQAQWTKELRMRPQEQLHVVSILGAAQVRYSELGALAADEIHLWLAETQKPPRTTPATAQVVTANYAPGYAPGSIRDDFRADESPSPGGAVPQKKSEPTDASDALNADDLQVVPDRMMAEGNVRIDSPQLTGGTRRLEVWFQPVSEESASGTDSEHDSAGQRNSRSGARARPFRSRDIKQTFDARGELMRLQLLMRENVTRINDVSIEGGARLVETKTRKPDELPLIVQGDRLQVAQADSDEAQVNVSGKPAMVEARGLALIGARINLDRATNRLWIDGPGRMRLPMDRDLNGNALAQRQTMEVDWQGGMQFDGKTVLYDRAVTARGEHQSLKTESLEVSLRRRVDFNNPQVPGEDRDTPTAGRQPGAQRDAAEVEQVLCRGGVTIQNKSFDEQGQLSTDQMQMRDIAINQVSGVIEGHGPGWITTVRRGSAAAIALPGSTPAPEVNSDRPSYSFLNVRFEGPIGGNVHRQELVFSEQVRAVYGPVGDWQSELDPDTPDELGPQAVLLNCDQLTVRQMPAATRGGKTTAELEAVGNTLVEGQTFTARAHKLSFAEAKDLLVLEGNGSTDAQLFRQARVGGATSQAAARRIMYWRSTNRVEVDDARFLDIGNIGGSKPGDSGKGGFPDLNPKSDKRNPLGPDAQRTPRGNGTALPSIRR